LKQICQICLNLKSEVKCKNKIENMSEEYNLGDFENNEIPNKKLTFGDIIDINMIPDHGLSIFENIVIDLDSIQRLIVIDSFQKSVTDKSFYANTIEANSKFKSKVCARIAELQHKFEPKVYNTIFKEFNDNSEVLSALAQNPNISLELAKKLCKIKKPKDIQLGLASNSGEELTLEFLENVPKSAAFDYYPFGEANSEIGFAVENNIFVREQNLTRELSRSVNVFGECRNEGLNCKRNIDLNRSIRACNDLGEFLQSIPIEPNYTEMALVRYEEVLPENIFDLLNPNNPESLVGMVIRIKEFFAEFESKWGIIGLSAMKLNSPLWRVAQRLDEDFRICIENYTLTDYRHPRWGFLQTWSSKSLVIYNSGGPNLSKYEAGYENDLIDIFKGIKEIKPYCFWKINFDPEVLIFSSRYRVEELRSVFDELVKYRDAYKHILAELQKTKLPSAEDLELEKMKQLAEQKLLAEGPLTIAQREFDENLSSIGDPLEYIKSEQTKQANENIRIQPFLQSFWDDINQGISEIEHLNNFQSPNYITNQGGEQLLESNEQAKTSFLKLINNLFIGNGNITRALNPSNDPLIPSPQSQIKDFYKQLNAKFIPKTILDENGKSLNKAEIDNNIFNNPELNLPHVYLEFVSTLLQKLRIRYEEILKERIEFEKVGSQDSVYLNITNQLKRERLKITKGLDVSVSDMISAEIEKVSIVQAALAQGLKANKRK
jgi:hypothetical protein